MKHMGVTTLLVLLLGAWGGLAAGADTLDAGFKTPPHSAGIRAFWWWLNGNVTSDAITRDLEEMKAKGFNGALIFDADGSSQRGNSKVPAGPIFGGPEWTKLFVHACKEAKRLAGMTGNAVALIMSRMPKDMRKPAVAMIADLRKAAEEVRDQIDCC